MKVNNETSPGMPQHCNEMPRHCNEMPQLSLSFSSAFPQHFPGFSGPYITTYGWCLVTQGYFLRGLKLCGERKTLQQVLLVSKKENWG